MSLDSLKSKQNSYKKDLSEEKANLEMYQEKVDALDSLYDKMKDKKEEMESLKKSLKSFVNESYDHWKGNVFNDRYETHVRDELLENGYGKMMTIIDNNLDEINSEKRYYQNLIYQSKGIIGDLQSVLNSIAVKIQNWVN